MHVMQASLHLGGPVESAAFETDRCGPRITSPPVATV